MSARLVQVTNVSTSVTKEQLRALFTHLGRIEDIQLYPESETLAATVAAKTGYIRFDRSELAHAALNLTNTVFLDRPIICSIVKYATSSSVLSSKAIAQLCRIPDETVAIKLCPPINTNITLIPGGITWPHNIINRIVTIPGVDANSSATSFIETLDPNLSEKSLPAYPPLPGSMDQQKAEEIRRTVYVSNLDPRVQFAHLYELFSQVGELRYVRLSETTPHVPAFENRGLSKMCLEEEDVEVDWNGISISAYIEFSEQPMVLKALCLNGLSFAGRTIKVNHATSAIIIPATNKQLITVEDIRKDISKLRQSSSSSSTSHRDRSEREDRPSTHRTERKDSKDSHDKSRRDRDRDRDRDRERHISSKSSSVREPTTTDKRKQQESSSSSKSSHRKKRDGSVDEKTSESEPEDLESGVANGSNPASYVESDNSESGEKPSSPKKARHSRSRSASKSKRETKRSKDRSSPGKHSEHRHRSSRERKRSSRSRDREKRERDLLKEKELREKLKASASKRSSREKEVSSRNRSGGGGGERASSKEHKRSNGSKAESSHKRDRDRKRSSSRSGKSKKRSKSKEKSSKEHKKSSRRRSKSPKEKNGSSRSSHKHSKSSRSDKKESRSEKRERQEENDAVVAVAKTRDYDEEERENAAMDVGEAAINKSPYGPEPANGNGNNKNESSSDDSGSSSSESEEENDTAGADEAMDVEQEQNRI